MAQYKCGHTLRLPPLQGTKQEATSWAEEANQ
jgi:hypothetical protein